MASKEAWPEAMRSAAALASVGLGKAICWSVRFSGVV
jgi:hypothetical protein